MDDVINQTRFDRDNLIEEPIQTSRALLVWQTPLNEKGLRTRHAVGELWRDNANEYFSYFGEDELAPARADGFREYPGLPFGQGHILTKGVDILFHRVIPSARPDYEDYLNQFGISQRHDLTRLSLLAYTGAHLYRDSYSVCETFQNFRGRFGCVFDVGGYGHWLAEGNVTEVGERVEFLRDPDNTADSSAVKIVAGNRDGRTLGHVDHLQSRAVCEWLDHGEITGRVFLNLPYPDFPQLYVRADIICDLKSVAARRDLSGDRTLRATP